MPTPAAALPILIRVTRADKERVAALLRRDNASAPSSLSDDDFEDFSGHIRDMAISDARQYGAALLPNRLPEFANKALAYACEMVSVDHRARGTLLNASPSQFTDPDRKGLLVRYIAIYCDRVRKTVRS